MPALRFGRGCFWLLMVMEPLKPDGVPCFGRRCRVMGRPGLASLRIAFLPCQSRGLIKRIGISIDRIMKVVVGPWEGGLRGCRHSFSSWPGCGEREKRAQGAWPKKPTT